MCTYSSGVQTSSGHTNQDSCPLGERRKSDGEQQYSADFKGAQVHVNKVHQTE